LISAQSRFNAPTVVDVEVTIVDNDRAGLDLRETNAARSSSRGERLHGYIRVSLTRAPTALETVTVTLSVDSPYQNQILLSPATLSFDSTTWNTPVFITITAVATDGVEDQMLVPIRHHLSSNGGTSPIYVGAPDQVLKATVVDGDSPALFVRETDGSTMVMAGSTPQSDHYFVRLTQAPAADETVTLTLRTDGQTLLSGAGPRFQTVESQQTPTYTLTFNAVNWSQEFQIIVSANPANNNANDLQESFPKQLHQLGRLEGPLIVEGGPSRARTGNSRLVWFTNRDSGFIERGNLGGNELGDVDVVNVFDDASVAGKTGTMTSFVNDLAANANTPKVLDYATGTKLYRLSGLDMADDLTLNQGTPANPNNVRFPGGITFHGVEVVEAMLGKEMTG